MKRLTAALISLLMIFSLGSAFAAMIPEIENDKNCVVDMADVISQETEDYLSALNMYLEYETGASIVIATVDFTGSRTLSEYAYEAFNKWGVGDADKDNGLLLLMSVGDEDYWAVQGKGIEKDLTSAELDQMLYDYLDNDFAKEDYDSGAKNFYLAAYEWFGDHYDVELQGVTGNVTTNPIEPGYEDNDDDEKGFGMGKILMWVAIIAIVVIVIAASTDNKSTPQRTYRPRVHTRRGPHTSTFRRTPPTNTSSRRTTVSRPTKTSSATRRTTSGRSSSRSTSSRSTTTRSSSSSSRSSGGRSGGFGGGSSRGGGAGRRK
ncbi:MAG: TPM domain-containing protein [Eubacteriaceae bacterium]|nr:TPM domain-containing protein [Eubacteriaceae bacterium]